MEGKPTPKDTFEGTARTVTNHNTHNAGTRPWGMGLGSTAKKIQTVADTAEKMYRRLNALRKEVESTKRTVEDTGERVDTLETEIAEQRVILEAIGEELDIDTGAAVDDADLGAESDVSPADSEAIPVEEGEADSGENTGDNGGSETDGAAEDAAGDNGESVTET